VQIGSTDIGGRGGSKRAPPLVGMPCGRLHDRVGKDSASMDD
jgi:hypothetical protein